MDTKNLKFILVRALVPLLIGFSCIANGVEPRVYQLGDGGAIAPHVALEFANDNNPLRSADGSEKSMYLRLQPSLKYLVRQRNNKLELGYSGSYYQYFEDYCSTNQSVRPGDCPNGSRTFDKASFQDHTLSLDGFLEISSRMRATLELSSSLDHQPLGTGQSGNRGILDSIPSPDAYRTGLARAEFQYGAARARGQLRGGITVVDRSFESERGDFSDKLDEKSVGSNVRLLYRIGTRTQLFAGLGRDEVRGGDSERDISRFIYGAELDASAITSGSVTFSSVVEDFVGSGAQRRDLDYFGMDIELTWRPRRYSTVTIGAGRETTRSLLNEGIALTTNVDIEWEHFWRDRFSTLIGVSLVSNDDLDRFTDLPDAEDKSQTLRFEANYNIRRWLDIGGFVEIDSRDGRDFIQDNAGAVTELDRDYARTVIGFTANGTI